VGSVLAILELTRRTGMMVRQILKATLAVGGMVIMLGALCGPAEALTCSATGSWAPDPSITNATSCGAGTANTNNNADILAGLNADTGITFALWDKDTDALSKTASLDSEGGAGLDSSFMFTVTTFNGGDRVGGQWFWNSTPSEATGNDTFAIVLKDGSVDHVSWAWFVLDNTTKQVGGCDPTTTFTYTYCGNWTMYGHDGIQKNLSHMAIYGADVVPNGVPEPSILVLLGIGLVAVGGVARRKFGRTTAS
jgi:hypothetical protein